MLNKQIISILIIYNYAIYRANEFIIILVVCLFCVMFPITFSQKN